MSSKTESAFDSTQCALKAGHGCKVEIAVELDV